MTPVLWMMLGAGLAYAASFAVLGLVVASSWLHGLLERRRAVRMRGWERIPH